MPLILYFFEMGNEKMSTLEVTKKAVRADLMTAFHFPNRFICIMAVITIETKESVRLFRNSLEELSLIHI